MSETADVVVAGGGHNSLIAAAYLAKAGYDVVVLDARSAPGGGAATEDLVTPGFHFDSCSTGHTLIQANPVLRDDELGLVADYGLEYIEPDPVAHVLFPDGEYLTMWHDLDAACEEIARYSRRDAESYRRMIAEYDEVKGVYGRHRFNPIGYAPPLEEMLAGLPGGSRWLRRNAIGAWDVIRHEFEDRHVQAFMLWMAFQTLQPVDGAGSGMLAYSLVAGRQGRSWILPRGGSGQLPAAIVRALEANGGRVVTGKLVSGLVIEGGRCAGVETADGERYMARRAVLSTIHVKQLVEMAPAGDWGDEFLYGVDTYDEGMSVFACYYATSAAPEFPTANGTVSAVSAGPVGWPEDVIRLGHEVRAGRVSTDGSWLLFATPTLADPSRAPEGKHTLKILQPQPWNPDARGPGAWDELKHEVEAASRAHLRRCAPNMTDDAIEGVYVKSPVDVERANPHMWHGTIHGGDRGLAHGGAMRPVPGWASHRMPIPGLYQTGATTHPGGSITGAPGRNAAMVMLTDFGHDAAAELSGSARRQEVLG